MKFTEKLAPVVCKVGSIATVGAIALQTMAVSAFAETSNSVDISAVTESMSASLTDIVGKVAIACAGIVGVGLTIFAIKWVVKTLKSFFSKIAG